MTFFNARFFTFLLLCFSCSLYLHSQDVTLSSQEEVNAFNETQVDNLTISGDGITTINISSLSSVLGRITIDGNADLISISFPQLETTTGRVWIINNPELTNISFPIITRIGNPTFGGGNSLRIHNNNNLLEVNSFPELEFIGDMLFIENNENLERVLGFNKLTAVENYDFEIRDNPSLQTIAGFSNLERVGRDFIINNNPQLANMPTYAQLGRVPRTLSVTNSDELTTINFSNLSEEVGAITLDNNDEVMTISFPQLETTTGRLWIINNPELTDISFPIISRVGNPTFGGGNSLRIHNNNRLLEVNSFPELEFIGDMLFIENNENLERVLGFNELTAVENYDFEIRDNPSLQTIDGFSNLERVGRDFIINNNPQLASMPTYSQLGRVPRTLSVTNSDELTTINFANLSEEVGAITLDNNDEVMTISFPQLETTTGRVWIINNPELTNISFPIITRVGNPTFGGGNSLRIHNNNNLLEVNSFPELEFIGDMLFIENNENLERVLGFNQLTAIENYDFEIRDNPSLQIIDGFSNLERVGRDFIINNNPQLATMPTYAQLGQVPRTLSVTNSDELTTINFANLSEEVGAITLDNNDEVMTISFPQLETTTGRVWIINNPELTNISFPIITRIGNPTFGGGNSLRIHNNNRLIEVNSFPELEFIGDMLFIENNENLERVLGFNQLTAIENYDFEIRDNPSLQTIDGFSNLERAGRDFIINNNPQLASMPTYAQLGRVPRTLSVTNSDELTTINFANLSEEVGAITLDNNDEVRAISFPQLETTTGRVWIINNPELTDISFPTVTRIGNPTFGGGNSLRIHNNNNLLEVSSFPELEFIGDMLFIENNENLERILGFNQLTAVENYDFEIRDNPSLLSLLGFELLDNIGRDLEVRNNPNLSLCCGIAPILDKQMNIGRNITINTNETGCNTIEEILGTLCGDGIVQTWYADQDDDGLGDVNNFTQSTTQPDGFVLNDDDCDDNNSDSGAKQIPGAACNDGDEATENDQIQADSCTCLGIIPVLCEGIGDADGDGICVDEDCNDNDPTIGARQPEGTSCDDGNPMTENDAILADGCTCEGTPIPTPTYNDTCGLADGLAAFFPMNNSPNDVINGNLGTVNGATLTTDRYGNENAAYEFDGINDYIDYGDSLEYRFAGDYSFSIWIQPDFIPQGAQILSKRRRNAANFYSLVLTNELMTGDLPPADFVSYVERIDQNGSFQSIANSNAKITTNWNQITITNQRDGRFYLYVNGELIDSSNVLSGTVEILGEPLYIGGQPFDNISNQYFQGKIDDIRLYQRFLSREEVGDLYECEKPTELCINSVDVDDDGICANEDCDDSPETGGNCSTGCQTFYADTDGDGFGDLNNTTVNCITPEGFVANADDCDDNNSNIPAEVGSECDDNDSTTINDVFLADGCTCEGTVENCTAPMLQTTQISAGSDSTFVLFENDFENPIRDLTTEFFFDLSSMMVSELYGLEFKQTFTVETILINGDENIYEDPQQIGGDYAIGMFCCSQNDLLAFGFDTKNLPFLNLKMDVSAIDILRSACGINGCVGNLTAPTFRISAYDNPIGSFNFSAPGVLLDSKEVIGNNPGVTPFTFNWMEVMTSIDVSTASSSNVTLVIDAISSGYNSFDNLSVTASTDSTSIGNLVTAQACETATLTGTLTSEETATLTASFGTITQNGNIWTWTSTELQAEDSQTVTITATNSCGMDEISFELVVEGEICLGGVPFECTPDVIEVRNGQLTVSDFNGDNRLNLGANGSNLNAIGFNIEDNFIYGITSNENNLVRLDAEGTRLDLGNLGLSSQLIGGDFDRQGNLYIVDDERLSLHKIDVSNLGDMQAAINLSERIQRTSDIAYNPANGLFYGIPNGGGVLYNINPINGEIGSLEIPEINQGRFGTVWMIDLANLAAYDSDRGILFQVNINTGVSAQINQGLGNVNNHDGARCNLIIPVDTTCNNILPTQTFTTQSQLDSFVCDCNKTIAGDLIINGDDINDLANLSCIKQVTGNVYIGDSLSIPSNDILQTLDGLGGIMSIGGNLVICNNPALINLDGFSSLMEIGGDIRVKNCRVIEYIRFVSLTSVGGSCIYLNLPTLRFIGSAEFGFFGGFGLTSFGGGVRYENLPELVWITGFDGLSEIRGDLYFINVPRLQSLEAYRRIIRLFGCLHLIETTQLVNFAGLDSLELVGEDIRIIDNDQITDLSQLGNLVTLNGSLIIKDNDNLMDLNGLCRLTSLADTLMISDNPLLDDCCCIDDLIQNGDIGGPVMISENLMGCMSPMDIDTTCNIPPPPNDRDMDGFTVDVDCNDNDPTIFPGAFDIPDNGIDENCDGEDTEGPLCLFDDPLTDLPFLADIVANPDPCYLEIRQGDLNGFPIFIIINQNICEIEPGVVLATELDRLIYNCQGEIICTVGFLTEPINCDDISIDGTTIWTPEDTMIVCPTIFEPVCANGMTFSNACEAEKAGFMEYTMGECEDKDNDGFTEADGDCNDNNPDIYPGATEILCDGVDSNCNGEDECMQTPTCEEGTPCDDGNMATINDVLTLEGMECVCVGEDTTTTNMEFCEEYDAYVGSPCDDGDPNTEDEWLEAGCKCVGQVINGCNAVITVRDNTIIVEEVNGTRIKVHLYDRTFSNALNTDCDYWNDCAGTQTFTDLLPGVYAVQYQSFNEDWTNIICDSVVYVEIVAPTDETGCENISIEVANGVLSIDNLPTLNTIIDVYDPNFRSMFNCIGDCGTSQTIENLPTGEYLVRLKVYDVFWNYVCEIEERIEIPAVLGETSQEDKEQAPSINPNTGRSTTIVIDKLSVFPNPTAENINVSIPSFMNKAVEITLIDRFGRIVQKHQLDKVNNSIFTMNIRDYAAGVYQVTAVAKGQILTTKVIILK